MRRAVPARRLSAARRQVASLKVFFPFSGCRPCRVFVRGIQPPDDPASALGPPDYLDFPVEPRSCGFSLDAHLLNPGSSSYATARSRIARVRRPAPSHAPPRLFMVWAVFRYLVRKPTMAWPGDLARRRSWGSALRSFIPAGVAPDVSIRTSPRAVDARAHLGSIFYPRDRPRILGSPCDSRVRCEPTLCRPTGHRSPCAIRIRTGRPWPAHRGFRVFNIAGNALPRWTRVGVVRNCLGL
jgi:hypothetical protein